MSLVFVDSFNLSDGPNFGFCLNCGKQYERNPLVEAERLCPGCYKNMIAKANGTLTKCFICGKPAPVYRVYRDGEFLAVCDECLNMPAGSIQIGDGLLCTTCTRKGIRKLLDGQCKDCFSAKIGRPKQPRFGGSYDQANNTITAAAPLKCKTCTRTNIKRLERNGQCPSCFAVEIGWQRSPRLQEKSVFGNCSVCMVAFTRVSAKVEIDRTEYCFPCWDELKRTGRVDLTRRPVAPELFPQPVNMPPLVEMRPKRQIQLED